MLHRCFCTCLFAIVVSNPLAAVATPPTANPDAAETPYNESRIISPVGNDTTGSSPFDLTTVTITAAPGYGDVFVDPETGDVEYQPDGDFIGLDSFSYTVKDENGEVSNEGIVTVSLTNEAPNIVVFNAYPGQGGMWHFEGMVLDEDPLSLIAEFGGVLEGHSVLVQPDGSFSYSAPVGVGGLVTVQTDQDLGGLVSNELAQDTGY